jgi:hypothetical protein
MTVKNLAGRVVVGILGFGNEIAEKLKKFLMKINNAYNFSYPQAGFWWLVDRKFGYER